MPLQRPLFKCLTLVLPPLFACVREADLSGLRVEIHEVLGNRNITDEQFKVRGLYLECVDWLKILVGLARTIYGIFSRKFTKYTVYIYGSGHIRLAGNSPNIQ